MIVKRLRIENIYSLKGKHVINFDQLSKQSNLLAITGKTGAGKSTILNCISLALYGKTHLKALVKEDYLTLGENKGIIELHFQVKGKNYIAYWSITAKGSLTRRIETPEGIQTNKINEFIQQIIKLNFDQFTKTVILNQGEFANFISSTFSQRKDLLEELINIQNLKFLSKQLKAEIKKIELEKENILSRLDATSIMDAHQFSELKASINQDLGAIQCLQKEIDQLKIVQHCYKTIHSNCKKLVENRENIQRYRETIASITSQQNSLKQELNQLEEKNNQLTDEYDKVRPLIKQAYALDEKRRLALYQITQAKQQAKKAEIKLEKKENELSKLEQHKNDLKQKISLLKLTLKIEKTPNCVEEITPLFKVIHDLSTTSKTLEHLYSQQKDTLDFINKQKCYIKEHNCEFDILQKEIDSTNLEILRNSLKKIEQSLIDQEILKKQQDDLTIQKETLDHEFTRLEELKKKLEQEYIDFEQQSIILKKEYDLLLEKEKNNKLEAAIRLVANENRQSDKCLVCHHPLEETLPYESRLHTKSEVNISEQIETLLQKISNFDKNLYETKQQITSNNLLLTQCLRDREKVADQSVYDKNIHDNIKVEYENLTKKINQYDINKTTLERIRKEITNRETEVHESEKKHVEINELIDIHTKTFNESKTALKKDIVTDIKLDKDSLEQLSYYLKHTEEFLRLDYQQSQLLEDIATHKNEINEFNQKINSNETEIKTITAEISELTRGESEISLYESKWQEMLKESEKKVRQQQQKVNTLEVENRELNARVELLNNQKQLIEKDNTSIFYDTEIKTINETSRDQIKALQFFDKIELMLTHPKENQLQELTFIIEDLIDSPLMIMSAERDRLQQQLAKKEERLNIQLEQEQKQEILLKQLAALKDALTPKKDLSLIIGNDDFRNYILSLVEAQLIEMSNLELESLCQGRYRLNQYNNEYYIVDGHKGAGLRKISTLSGGEKFMVSLSMALGLAEMTRGETEIDSFFIDEGFGSLDDDSLEEIVEVLYNVQSRGKLVTIITHVKELARRLPVNLHVKKESFGSSKIEVLYN